MQLEWPNASYHSNHKTSSSTCLHQPSTSSPPWLVHRPHTPCIEIINHSEVRPKLHCSSSWLSKSMQLELPNALYHSNHKTSSTSWLHQPSSPHWLIHTPEPTMYWNHQPQLISRSKITLQFILTIEVNAIGTDKCIVSLQSQDFFLYLSPSAFQSPVTCTYTTTHHVLKSSTTANKKGQNCTAVHLDYQSQCNWNCQNLHITPITRLLPLPVSIRLPMPYTTTHHVLKSSTTAK
jgi:hypothetical protein